MNDTNTSMPGPGSDPLEPEFEKMLADEGVELEGRNLPKPEVKPEVPPKNEEKPADVEPPKPEVPPVVPPKTPEAKPEVKPEAWRLKVAEKREAKQQEKDAEIDRLRKENELLKTPKDPNAPSKPADQSNTVVELTSDQKTLADKYGIEHEDYLKMFPTTVIEKEVIKSGLSPEQVALLTTVQSERETQAIANGFNNDFNANVLPLIKAEYPGISDAKIEEIKSKVFDKIQADEYSMTPLNTLYKGEDEFRGVINTPKISLDEGSKVPGNNNSGKVYDFDNVTETDLKASDFPFEKYSAFMASKESGAKRN